MRYKELFSSENKINENDAATTSACNVATVVSAVGEKPKGEKNKSEKPVVIKQPPIA